MVGPLTAEGTIVVNNFAASCYAIVENHELVHTLFAPLRFTYNWFPGLLTRENSNEEKGYHWYVDILSGVGHHLHPYVITQSELSSSFYNHV